ncbi:SDR family oxidoreductase [Streptomyces sp. NBC_01351]|uniref:SDR family oxidoreductase n=1 Tax=Streptomyces sp. NBC_01351 TaxID=2903833 RepID=UPI002E3750A8|nr:SDR family oxidoreductase [Streptomyces sp. NBC_01351]
MKNTSVVVTGAARDFGRTLAIRLAALGAEVFLSARNLKAAEATRDEILALGHTKVHAFACDVGDPESVRAFAEQVGRVTDRVDILLNNGAGWLDGFDLGSVSDEEIMATVTSAGVGTVLMTKHFLPLLRASQRPDIVNIVSLVASGRSDSSSASPAFYAAKGAQANFADIMSQRLRSEGVRVISLYPPDFRNVDPLGPEWDGADRGPGTGLTAQSLLDCILFAVNQPRDCFIRTFGFEPVAGGGGQPDGA